MGKSASKSYEEKGEAEGRDPVDSASARPEARSEMGAELTIVTGRGPVPAPTAAHPLQRLLEGRVMPGDRLGQFELVEYIGGGGMGRVFRAVDRVLDRTVAIKVLPPDQAADAATLQRFKNEAQSVARLDHDNIVRTYCAGEDSGLHYIAFEFIEGSNLRTLVERKGPLALAEALNYAIQVAAALAHADGRAVVHRDIKPSNVLITAEGRAKLIDLGLARLQQDSPAGNDLTASGVTLGTFDYIAPEQARDPRGADTRSDIYSLGCTLFFMLTGQPPFPEGTVLQKLLKHQGDPPPDIQQLRANLPNELRRILQKMMAKRPQDRHANPGELLVDLIRLAERIGLQPSRGAMLQANYGALKSQPLKRWQRHLPWIVPTAALIAIVFVLHQLWSASTPADDVLPPAVIGGQLDTSAKHAGATAATPKTKAVSPSPAPSPANAQEPALVMKEQQSFGGVEQSHGRIRVMEEAGAAAGELAKDQRRAEATPGEAAKRAPAGASAAAKGPTPPPSEQGGPSERRADPKRLAADGAAKTNNAIVVRDNPTGEREFANLSGALAAARNGDIIELRFNGPHEERPMKVSNLQVTIRSGEGFRPILVFRPDEINPITYPRSMITLSGGRLVMTDVGIELDVPREFPADNWSLIETWGGQAVRLERCVLTVRNASDRLTAYHQEAAFVRARPAPDASVSTEGQSMATPLTAVELFDCVARGEADFLCVEDLQPVYLLWDNGLVTISDRLLVCRGGQVAPRPEEILRVELRHVTTVVRGGLCRLGSSAANPYQLPVQFTCTESIVWGAQGVPMIEQEGNGAENTLASFTWNGNRNWYQEIDVFWTIRNADPASLHEIMTFEGWKGYWGPSRENQPHREALPWKTAAGVNRPLHAHTAADYTLGDRKFGGPAGEWPGCRQERLPGSFSRPTDGGQSSRAVQRDSGWSAMAG